jgi:hypothetical protein
MMVSSVKPCDATWERLCCGKLALGMLFGVFLVTESGFEVRFFYTILDFEAVRKMCATHFQENNQRISCTDLVVSLDIVII